MKKLLLTLSITLLLASCQKQQQSVTVVEAVTNANPAAEGFRLSQSDEKAVQLADEVMQAMGGRNAWDNTAYLQWTFFGRRHLLWDKASQRVRVEYPDKELIIVASVDGEDGKVWQTGEEVSAPDSLKKYLTMGKEIWINDAYWLVMPFKLKDSGVALKYAREDTTQTGAKADVLSLTFEDVGVTPENKYEVWVEQQSGLVKQWAYFATASQDTANFVTPWTVYQPYGNIKLSGNRGRGQLSNIKVLDAVDSAVFNAPTMVLPM